MLPRVNLAAIQFCRDYYQPFWDKGLGAQCGILVLPESPKKAEDFALISQRFADRPEIVESLNQCQLRDISGIQLQAEIGIYLSRLCWLPPALVCQQLLQENQIPLVQADINRLERDENNNRWHLVTADNEVVHSSESVLIASAYDCGTFPRAGIFLRQLRGQITQLPATAESKLKTVVCGEGYFTPAEMAVQLWCHL